MIKKVLSCIILYPLSILILSTPIDNYEINYQIQITNIYKDRFHLIFNYFCLVSIYLHEGFLLHFQFHTFLATILKDS